MKRDAIKIAVLNAAKFVAAATELMKAQQDAPCYRWPKESGATRRASMELTRSLATMRRPQ